MPKNNNLEPKKFPFEVMFDKPLETSFYNNLNNIKVGLIEYPDYDEITKTCIMFSNATWKDNTISKSDIDIALNEATKNKFMYHIFNRKIYPGTLETIKLTFLIDGISLQEVTHILRYRKAVFAAECSGDKFLYKKGFIIPTAVQNSPSFLERYKKICLESKELYKDMVDSKLINALDARYIIPKAMETYYYMSITLRDLFAFIYDRVDKQIQPQSDNVIAYKMILELTRVYPILSLIFDDEYINKPAIFYQKTARQYRSTSLFCPDENNDKFEWNENDFIYKDIKRDDILGELPGEPNTDVFRKIKKETEEILKERKKKVLYEYSKKYLESDFTEEEMFYFDRL